MKRIWLCALVIVLSLQLCSAKVKLVIDTIRHGARGSGANYPFFPNLTWQLPMELTSVGERQHCLLGRLRRSQYIEREPLLPPHYDPSTIYVRSTDIKRTFMSAQSYLLGLYPTGLSKLNSIQLKYANSLLVPPIPLTISEELIRRLKDSAVPFDQPIIPIISVNESTETLLFSSNCPWLSSINGRYFSTQEYHKLLHESFRMTWDEVIKDYPSLTWTYLSQGQNAYGLADFIITLTHDGRKPAGLRSEVVKQLERFMGGIQKGMLGQDPRQNKIGMADYTQEVLGFLNATIEGRSPLKYVLYSAHDTTQITIFIGLHRMNTSIDTDRIPNFASNLLFELHGPQDSRNPSDHYVTILHNGTVIHSESYPAFKVAFAALGDIGMTREQACKHFSGNELQPPRRFVGLPEDFQ